MIDGYHIIPLVITSGACWYPYQLDDSNCSFCGPHFRFINSIAISLIEFAHILYSVASRMIRIYNVYY